MSSQHLAISAEVGSGTDRSGCAMKTASNSGCSRSPNRKTLNIASFKAVRCPQRYEIRFFPGATSANSCSSEQLKHSVPTRFITCSHDEIAVWMSNSSDAIESWLLSLSIRLALCPHQRTVRYR